MSGKYHIVKDESLGGIERIFVEVERKADVGDYVHITRYDNDDVSTIGRVSETDLVCGELYADYIQGDKIELYDGDLFVDHDSGDKYVTLEPIESPPHNESDEILERLSALAVEVTELKRRLDEMQSITIDENFVRKTVTYEYERK